MTKTRRSFLGALGLGAAGLAAPYIPLMTGEVSAANGFPTRLLFVLNGNGTVQEEFWPDERGGSLDLTTSRILSPLAPFQDRAVVVRGIRHAIFEHGPGEAHDKAKKQVLTQRELRGNGSGAQSWPGESVDHAVARAIEDSLRGAGETPPPVRLMLTSINRSSRDSFTAAGPGSPLPYQHDPRVVFDELFSTLETGSAMNLDPAMDRRLAERSAVFEAVAYRLGEIEQAVGVDGRRKTEAHLASITELQESLAGLATRGATCGRPDVDFAELRASITDTDLPTTATLHGRLVASALACDLTRVATLVHVGGSTVASWLGDIPLNEGRPANVHTLAHYGTRQNAFGPAFHDAHIRLEEWRATKIRELLEMLDAVPEGDGTMLDNTLVVWTSDMARGNHHIDVPAPVVLFGGAGGALQTGRLVTTEASFTELLGAVGRLMAVDIGPFGDARFHGDVSEL